MIHDKYKNTFLVSMENSYSNNADALLSAYYNVIHNFVKGAKRTCVIFCTAMANEPPLLCETIGWHKPLHHNLLEKGDTQPLAVVAGMYYIYMDTE